MPAGSGIIVAVHHCAATATVGVAAHVIRIRAPDAHSIWIARGSRRAP